MLLTVPTSDKHTEVKISVLDAEGNELSSESTCQTTVVIKDEHWNSECVAITSQFIGPDGRPDPACPVEFLRKGKSHETPAEESHPEAIVTPASSPAPAEDRRLDDPVEHTPASEPRFEGSSECPGHEPAAEPEASDGHPQVKPPVKQTWSGLPPVKRNKR